MKGRVLIVDDVPDIRLMLRYMIERANYEIVAEATNGIEAVEKYRQYLPDITVMDVEMPFKTGVEAAEEIRAFCESARIIFCSASFSSGAPQLNQLAREGHTLIPKPFLPAQLYEALAS